jgi:hypothetical protein
MKNSYFIVEIYWSVGKNMWIFFVELILNVLLGEFIWEVLLGDAGNFVTKNIIKFIKNFNFVKFQSFVFLLKKKFR